MFPAIGVSALHRKHVVVLLGANDIMGIQLSSAAH